MAGGRHGRAARRRTFDDFDGLAAPPPSPDDRDLSLDVVDEITWYMREHKVTRAQLAGAMGVSPGRVSRLLSGGESLTPRTLCAVLVALGARLDITVRPASEPAPL